MWRQVPMQSSGCDTSSFSRAARAAGCKRGTWASPSPAGVLSHWNIPAMQATLRPSLPRLCTGLWPVRQAVGAPFRASSLRSPELPAHFGATPLFRELTCAEVDVAVSRLATGRGHHPGASQTSPASLCLTTRARFLTARSDPTSALRIRDRFGTDQSTGWTASNPRDDVRTRE